LALRELLKKSGKIFALTHKYTGYPMVKLSKPESWYSAAHWVEF
jgi:hypothetical protein